MQNGRYSINMADQSNNDFSWPVSDYRISTNYDFWRIRFGNGYRAHNRKDSRIRVKEKDQFTLRLSFCGLKLKRIITTINLKFRKKTLIAIKSCVVVILVTNDKRCFCFRFRYRFTHWFRSRQEHVDHQPKVRMAKKTKNGYNEYDWLTFSQVRNMSATVG